MNWLNRFLYGRNGPDQLSLALLIAGFLLSIASRLIPVEAVRLILQLINYLLLVLLFFRILSRNVYKRREENAAFLELIHPVGEWFRLRMRMARELRTHRYLRCPKCRQRLRVPRGAPRRKISITCSKCGEKFIRKV